jgi:hypothetical protein
MRGAHQPKWLAVDRQQRPAVQFVVQRDCQRLPAAIVQDAPEFDMSAGLRNAFKPKRPRARANSAPYSTRSLGIRQQRPVPS